MHRLALLDPELIQRSLFPRRPAPKPSRAALDLAQTTGLVEPIVVRREGNPAFPRYELLSGEMSLEIAFRAVLPHIPAVVIESISAEEAKAFARVHLTPGRQQNVEHKLSPSELFQILEAIEHAKSIRGSHGGKCTYASLGREYGISSVLVSHLRRVKRSLHRTCFDDLFDGRLSLGHAKALARFPKNEQPRIATRIIRGGYSVRRVETSARNRYRQKEDELNRGIVTKDPDILRAEQQIAHRFGWRTEIAFDPETQRGCVSFCFDSLDGFDYLLEQLGIDPRFGEDLP